MEVTFSIKPLSVLLHTVSAQNVVANSASLHIVTLILQFHFCFFILPFSLSVLFPTLLKEYPRLSPVVLTLWTAVLQQVLSCTGRKDCPSAQNRNLYFVFQHIITSSAFSCTNWITTTDAKVLITLQGLTNSMTRLYGAIAFI